MKLKRLGILVGMFSLLVLGACSKENKEMSNTTQTTSSEVTVSNKANVKGLVKALEKKNLKFKLGSGDEWNLTVIQTYQPLVMNGDGGGEHRRYGYDNPTEGTSIVAYADNQKLNQEQSNALAFLLGSAVDEKGDNYDEIWKDFPECFTSHYPNEGVSFDYVTVSNVQTEEVEEPKDFEVITAEITLHFRQVDGIEVTKKYYGKVMPNAGETPLDKKEVEEATHVEIMNEPLPTKDRLGYVPEEDQY